MRGFRTNRAMQNFKSARVGKEPHLKLIQGGLSSSTFTSPERRAALPDWLKVPQSVIDAQAGPQPSPYEEPQTKAKKAVKAKKTTTAKTTPATKRAAAKKKRATATRRAPAKTRASNSALRRKAA